MKFSLEFSVLLNNQLERNGILRKKNIRDDSFCIFSEEEISKITRLEIIGLNNIEEIIKLSNLHSLKVYSVPYTNVMSGVSLIDNPMINNITDFGPIEMLQNLEELIIANDINIHKLDITNLKKLKRLELSNNPELETLEGLDELPNLQYICMYGNNITNDFDIKKYIDNTLPATRNVLDMSLYISLVKKYPYLAKQLADWDIVGKSNVKFAEKSGFYDFVISDAQNLNRMYFELDDLFKGNNLYNKSDLDKINFVYNYVVNNIEFAKEDLKQRYQLVNELRKNHNVVPEYYHKQLASLHGGYNAYYFKKSNCEGGTNLMSFMFNMLGVSNFNVHCRDLRYPDIGSTNHSLIRILYKDTWLYCDAFFELGNAHKYFMIEYDDITKTHGLNAYEEKKCIKERENVRTNYR